MSSQTIDPITPAFETLLQTLAAGWPLLPVFLSYVLSFVYLGIYWNNHHHMLKVTPRVSGSILWANLHLLFWLSLVPFVTGWMGENNFAPAPTALYGLVLLIAAIAYWLLQRTIIAEHGETSLLAAAVGRDLKGKLSPVLYAIAIPSAFVHEWIAGGLYVLVALLWLSRTAASSELLRSARAADPMTLCPETPRGPQSRHRVPGKLSAKGGGNIAFAQIGRGPGNENAKH